MENFDEVKQKATRYTTWGQDDEPDDSGGFLVRDIVRFFIVALIAMAAIRLLLERGGFSSVNTYVFTILASKVILLGYLSWLIRARGDAWPETGATTIGRWWVWPLAVLAFGFCYLFMIQLNRENVKLMAWLYDWLGMTYRIEPQVVLVLIAEDILNAPTRMALVLFTVVIGPFTEELAFRGVGMDALWRRWGTVAAVVITSVLFAVFHFSVEMLLPMTALGLFFALVRIFSRSLWCPVFIHCLYNGLTLGIVAYQAGALDDTGWKDRLVELFGYLPEFARNIIIGG